VTQPITLTLSLEDYNALQLAKQQALEETAEVRRQLEAAKFVDGDARVAVVTRFARDCLTVARFAVANLAPELTRGWPFEALRRIADTIDVLPDYTLQDRDMAIDLRSFARECEQHEIRRHATGREISMPPVDKSAPDV